MSHVVITVSGFKNSGCQSSSLIGPNGANGENAPTHAARVINKEVGNAPGQVRPNVWVKSEKQKVVIWSNVKSQNGQSGPAGQTATKAAATVKQVEPENAKMDDAPRVNHLILNLVWFKNVQLRPLGLLGQLGPTVKLTVSQKQDNFNIERENVMEYNAQG